MDSPEASYEWGAVSDTSYYGVRLGKRFTEFTALDHRDSFPTLRTVRRLTAPKFPFYEECRL